MGQYESRWSWWPFHCSGSPGILNGILALWSVITLFICMTWAASVSWQIYCQYANVTDEWYGQTIRPFFQRYWVEDKKLSWHVITRYLLILWKSKFYCFFICGNKMPTRCNRGFYCRSYCLLNMFRAPLCPSSGAQEYYTVVAACGILCCKNVKIIL